MKAVVLEKLNAPLSVREVELTNLKVGQVLVKVLVSGLCGSQVQEIRGYKGNERFLPHLMGHEGCGIVEEIGPGVTRVHVKDKVVMHWRQGSGIESSFPQYVLDGRVINSGKVTTLNEYSIVSENRLTAVPHDTPDAFCALMGCGLTTAFGIINHEADLKFGESVAIIGCGGVGLNLIQAAAMRFACPLIAVDINENKKEKCLNLNADLFINPSTEDLGYSLKKHLPEGIDLIIDTTGNPKVLKEVSKYLSHHGRLILVGQPAPGESLEIPNANELFQGLGKRIQATQGGKTNPDIDIPRYVKLYQSGKFRIDQIISHTFALNEINEAFDLLRTGNAGRILIKISGK